MSLSVCISMSTRISMSTSVNLTCTLVVANTLDYKRLEPRNEGRKAALPRRSGP